MYSNGIWIKWICKIIHVFVDFLDAQTGDEHFLTTTRKIKVKVSGCVYSIKKHMYMYILMKLFQDHF